MHPKDAEGIANSVDPDQTAPLIWVCTVCPGLSVRKLRKITVTPLTLHMLLVSINYVMMGIYVMFKACPKTFETLEFFPEYIDVD